MTASKMLPCFWKYPTNTFVYVVVSTVIHCLLCCCVLSAFERWNWRCRKKI